MENVVGTPLKNPIQSENTNFVSKSPPQDKRTDQTSQNSIIDCPKSITPDGLSVSKAFKYPERYNSPTDLMMSPISRGLLARTKKGGGPLLPPTRTQPKMQDLCAQDGGFCNSEIASLETTTLFKTNHSSLLSSLM